MSEVSADSRRWMKYPTKKWVRFAFDSLSNALQVLADPPADHHDASMSKAFAASAVLSITEVAVYRSMTTPGKNEVFNWSVLEDMARYCVMSYMESRSLPRTPLIPGPPGVFGIPGFSDPWSNQWGGTHYFAGCTLIPTVLKLIKDLEGKWGSPTNKWWNSETGEFIDSPRPGYRSAAEYEHKWIFHNGVADLIPRGPLKNHLQIPTNILQAVIPKYVIDEDTENREVMAELQARWDKEKK